jgi:hypothetical protein
MKTLTKPTANRHLPHLNQGNLVLVHPYSPRARWNDWIYALIDHVEATDRLQLVSAQTKFTWRDTLVVVADTSCPSLGWAGIPDDELHSWWMEHYADQIRSAVEARATILIGIDSGVEYLCYQQLLAAKHTYEFRHESGFYRFIPKARAIHAPVPAPFLAA